MVATARRSKGEVAPVPGARLVPGGVEVAVRSRTAEAVEDAPILWRMKSDLERFGIDANKRRELFRRLGLGSLRPVLARERQLWIAAEDDVYIKQGLVKQQWKEWNEPPIVWIPGGHMTFPLSIGRIVGSMRDFVKGLEAPRARSELRAQPGLA